MDGSCAVIFRDSPLVQSFGLDPEQGLVCRTWSSALGLGERDREGGQSPLGSIRWGPWRARGTHLKLPTAGTDEGHLFSGLVPWSGGRLCGSPSRTPSWAWAVPCAAEEGGAGREGHSCRRQASGHPSCQAGRRAYVLSGGLAHSGEFWAALGSLLLR